MFRRLNDYIEDKIFNINIYNNKVNINNYEEIITLTDTLIIVRYIKKYIYIKGDNLSIRKLLDNELLIDGNIREILFNDK